jgi:hypothetical protein
MAEKTSVEARPDDYHFLAPIMLTVTAGDFFLITLADDLVSRFRTKAPSAQSFLTVRRFAC